MDEPKFLDMETFHGQSEDFGYKQICLRQFQRVATNMSNEMREGITIFSQFGNKEPQVSKYFPDTRKQFTQSVDCLHDMLLGRFDKIMKEKSKEINDGLAELKETSSNEKEYWKNKLDYYRQLFQELCLLLERLKWFETQVFEE